MDSVVLLKQILACVLSYADLSTEITTLYVMLSASLYRERLCVIIPSIHLHELRTHLGSLSFDFHHLGFPIHRRAKHVRKRL